MPTFFGVESEHSAFEIGEQSLGNIRLSGLAVVQLFEQYLYQHLTELRKILTAEQFPPTLLSAWDRLGHKALFN